TSVELFEEPETFRDADEPSLSVEPRFQSLEAFRPIAERAVDVQIAEAQRREFFAQLHRWLRQGFAVHVFCNNDGERQRFDEIWQEFGFANSASEAVELALRI